METEELERKIEYTNFDHIDDIKLPVLVLAVKYRPELIERRNNFDHFINNTDKYNFTSKREWLNIIHQTAGHYCNIHYMTGTILKPRAETYEGMKQINNSWLDSNCRCFGVSLDEVLEYRGQLKNLLDVDCNSSYINFEEGIYPIDCNVENIRKLVLDEIPDDIDDFIKWKDDFEDNLKRAAGYIGRWNLYILGENCD